jgi:hypothetical protein
LLTERLFLFSGQARLIVNVSLQEVKRRWLRPRIVLGRGGADSLPVGGPGGGWTPEKIVGRRTRERDPVKRGGYN